MDFDNYDRYPLKGCFEEADIVIYTDVISCKNACDRDDECISFVYFGSGRCEISYTCDMPVSRLNDDSIRT
eukprot:Awhi_evm1s13562